MNNEEIVDLEIQTTLSLSNESYEEFFRTFDLFKKQGVHLIHIECRSTENNIRNVVINVTLNGVNTEKIFWDSSQNYSAPYSFFAGTILILRLNEVGPIYFLRNMLNFSIQVHSSSYYEKNKGNFVIEEVSFQSLTPPIITSENIEDFQLPLEIARGEWYISPLSTLSERNLQTKVFAYVTEELPLRITIEVISPSLSLATFSCSILTNQNSLQYGPYTEDEFKKVFYMEMKQNEELNLELRVKLPAEMKENIIKFTIRVTASVSSPFTSETSLTSSFNLDSLPIQFEILELLRICSLIIPLYLFYKRKRNQLITNSSIFIEETSGED